jgi:predicted MFS family arabinose efflux permease
MTTGTRTRPAPPATTYRELFAVREWRALWIAQLVSIAGDQFARIALAVLVYDRTRSPLLAAVTFAATSGAMFAGGLLLGWTADRYPRRRVMLACDVICVALVALMLIPGMPLAALVVLLFAVGLAVEPFLSARMATNAEVLGEDRFALGQGITIATYQVAQLAGFALGGVVTGVLGVRAALAIDAASFAVSALLIRFGVRPRPAPNGGAGPARPQILAGVRVVRAAPAAAVATGLLWLAAFFGAPEGVTVPLAGQLDGGAATAGVLLAAMAAGAGLGPLAYTRLLSQDEQSGCLAATATAACAVLILFAATPSRLAVAVIILFLSGLYTGYIPAASGAAMAVIPDRDRGKAGGVIGAGMSLGQGMTVIAAGAVAQRVSPALVIAITGMAGTACGIPLALRWRKVRVRH